MVQLAASRVARSSVVSRLIFAALALREGERLRDCPLLTVYGGPPNREPGGARRTPRSWLALLIPSTHRVAVRQPMRAAVLNTARGSSVRLHVLRGFIAQPRVFGLDWYTTTVRYCARTRPRQGPGTCGERRSLASSEGAGCAAEQSRTGSVPQSRGASSRSVRRRAQRTRSETHPGRLLHPSQGLALPRRRFVNRG